MKRGSERIDMILFAASVVALFVTVYVLYLR